MVFVKSILEISMNRLLKLLAVFLLLIPMITSAQLFKKKVNRVNENGNRKGLWISYWNEKDKTLQTKYYYKDGHETRVCKNYYGDGEIRLKFRYYGERIRVKYFDEERKITHKGWAKWELTEKDLNYYWDGKWKFYDENQKLIKVEMWKKGVVLN